MQEQLLPGHQRGLARVGVQAWEGAVVLQSPVSGQRLQSPVSGQRPAHTIF